MIEANVYIAASIDGFIARENGDIDWLPTDSEMSGGEDYGYDKFIDTVDAIVMGSGTYEKVLTFGMWPFSKPVFVLSTRALKTTPQTEGKAIHLHGDPLEISRHLKERGINSVYVDGGKTIQAFLAAGLVKRMIITRIPVLIGSGLPLFGKTGRDIRLRHVNTHAFSNGLVQSEYVVA